MSGFVEVARLDQVPVGQGRPVWVGGKVLALFNVGGTIHAMEDACLHAGASLAGGRLQGAIVACPAHGWRFDVTTGGMVHAPGCGLATYPVRVEAGAILVAIGSPQPAG